MATVSRAELTEVLAASLGKEKADAVVASALSALGMGGGSLSPDDCGKVLDEVAKEGGLVRAAARIARVRVAPS